MNSSLAINSNMDNLLGMVTLTSEGIGNGFIKNLEVSRL
jgi:hypothetical protein